MLGEGQPPQLLARLTALTIARTIVLPPATALAMAAEANSADPGPGLGAEAQDGASPSLRSHIELGPDPPAAPRPQIGSR